MTTPRNRTSSTTAADESDASPHVVETPDLNAYEVHSERTVLTEPGNTDGWIATDMTVTPPE